MPLELGDARHPIHCCFAKCYITRIRDGGIGQYRTPCFCLAFTSSEYQLRPVQLLYAFANSFMPFVEFLFAVMDKARVGRPAQDMMFGVYADLSSGCSAVGAPIVV